MKNINVIQKYEIATSHFAGLAMTICFKINTFIVIARYPAGRDAEAISFLELI